MINERDVFKLINNKNISIENICRFCISLNDKLLPIFPIAEKVYTCTSININMDDGLPSRICAKCSTDLEAAESFRKRCIYIDNLLRKALSEIKYKNELSDSDISEGLDKAFTESLHFEGKVEITFEPSPSVSDYKEPFNENISLKQDGDVQKYCQEECTSIIEESENIFMKKLINNNSKMKEYKCIECSYITNRKRNLKFHIRKHTGEKPHVCDICGKSFITPSSLFLHKKIHSGKLHNCSLCTKQFRYKQHYTRHINTVHSCEKKFTCFICKKALKSKDTLKIHLNRHNNIKNFTCEVCGASFVTVSELIGHTATHTSDTKKYICDVCNFRSHKKTGMERHMKSHFGGKTFQCVPCQKSFYTRGELKKHGTKHTRLKNYTCSICGEKFMHSPSLNKHMLNKHKIKFKWSDVVDRRIVK